MHAVADNFALLADLYEFTMGEAYYAAGKKPWSAASRSTDRQAAAVF